MLHQRHLTRDTNLPRHSGEFYEFSPDMLPRLLEDGYERIGAAAVLLNSRGQIAVIDCKGNEKVADHTLSITSETVGGFQRDGSIHAEPIIQSLGRCIQREVGIDVHSACLQTRPEHAYTLTDWPIGTFNYGKLFGINIAILVDDATAQAIEQMTGTDEAHDAYFVDQDELLGGWHDPLRPGTHDSLKSLHRQGLLDPSNLTARLIIPPLVEPEFDIDLRSL